MAHQPTDEQQAIYDAAATRQNLTIEAGAGSGKTTTVRGISLLPQMSGKGMYYAYNRSVADEAARSFPAHVWANTGHGFAYREVADRMPWMRDRLFGARQSGKERARMLRLNSPERISPLVMLAPTQLARIAMDTVDRFAQSGDPELSARHVARVTGLEDPADRRALAYVILPIAQRAWKIILDPQGELNWNHDYYVKIAQLNGLTFGADYLMLDEAQDSNGVTIAVVKRQMEAGTQIYAVGDRNQQLYAWRGAVDAMGEFGGLRLFLSKSFRFGPAIAAEANKFLTLLDADLRLTGHDPIESVVARIQGSPDAILCRTNGEAMTQIMDLQDQGVRVAFVDGKDPGSQMKRLAVACDDLRADGFTSHPELTAFSSWGQVLDYVDNDHGGSDLSTAVTLIEKYGTDAIVGAVHRLVPESRAGVTVSTAHKAKGREWKRVRIANDFQAPKPDKNGNRTPSREEAMLAYVAVTRAQEVLDRGSLAWVDEVLAEKQDREEAARPRITLGPADDPDLVTRVRIEPHTVKVGDTMGPHVVIDAGNGKLATIMPLDLDALDGRSPSVRAMLTRFATTPIAVDTEPAHPTRPGTHWTEADEATVAAAARADVTESIRVAGEGTAEEKVAKFGAPIPHRVQRAVAAAAAGGLDMGEVVLADASAPTTAPESFESAVDPLIAETAPTKPKVLTEEDLAALSMQWGEDPRRPGSCGAKHKSWLNTYCLLDPHSPDHLHRVTGISWDDSQCSELGVAPAHA